MIDRDEERMWWMAFGMALVSRQALSRLSAEHTQHSFGGGLPRELHSFWRALADGKEEVRDRLLKLGVHFPDGEQPLWAALLDKLRDDGKRKLRHSIAGRVQDAACLTKTDEEFWSIVAPILAEAALPEPVAESPAEEVIAGKIGAAG